MRVTYFTAGSHGAGHIVRACALQRAFARAGTGLTLTVVAPPSPFLRLLDTPTVPVDVDAAALRDPALAPDSAVARAIRSTRPDLVVIDVFWVPLVFVPLPCPTWLLLRSVPPAWLVGPREARFDAGRYERTIAIEPAPGLEPFEALAPITVANARDRLPRARLAAALGVDDDGSPLRVIVRGGLDADAAILADAAHAVHPGPWHTLDLRQPQAPFPVAPLLAEADAVVAAPGYNTFWEAQVLGFAARTTWVPIRRAIDDAAWRAGLPVERPPTENGADTLTGWLADRLRRGS